MLYEIPKEAKDIAQALQKEGFSAYLVGGCVRDLLMKRSPKDWDITTNARPEEILKIFPESVYENSFGTVAVKTGSEEPTLKIVEVTTFRVEGKYTDKRHPDEVKFVDKVEDDLSRRDFTVNAIALDLSKSPISLIDPFGGQNDIKNKLVCSVGNAQDRFSEDALRLMRAVRFGAQLGFSIEDKTAKAIKDLSPSLELVSCERVRDEFSKLLMTDRAHLGLKQLQELGLLKYIAPEIEEGVGVNQNKHHIYTVFEHSLKSLEYAVKNNHPLELRLAALLHDVGKPRTKRGEGANCTFYSHEVVGAKIAVKILDKLRFSKDLIEKVGHLVRWHMFYYNVGEVSESGVRRFLRRVGPENLDYLLKLRESDRIGSGVPKAVPYKMRHLLFMIDKVKRDPISPKALKINGEDVIKELSIEPGPRIGHLLAMLLEEVLEKPELNEREALIVRLKELNKLSDAELMKKRKKAEAIKEEFEAGVEKQMKKKHFVK